ncbi:carbohydrate ABC transporter permease [Paenibacillus sepulcri]|uniref:Sugar ABC transporter permease n=1 Tax=Paenibacillus sepulcri TaxID=359917 RepID=A0ABS7C4F1_9BACL|nr:sugar ABC transporter permease [Paenibacillus sepulcri]
MAGMRFYRWMPFVFVVPSIAMLALFVFYPTFNAAWTSLTDWNGIAKNPDFIGLQNYAELFGDEDFLGALLNTCEYVALSLPATLVLAVGAALLIEKTSVISTVLRMTFAIPFVVSIAVTSVVWVWIVDPNFGVLNYAFDQLGWEKQKWLNEPGMAMVMVAIPSIWRQFGYFMLILLAGLKGLDVSYQEAAKVDGASYWVRTLRITVPLLGPQLFFCLVLGVIDSFQVFAQVDLMTHGGPLNSTNVVVYYLYKQGFEYFHIGYASAIAMVLMILLGILTFAQQRWIGSKVFYQ